MTRKITSRVAGSMTTSCAVAGVSLRVSVVAFDAVTAFDAGRSGLVVAGPSEAAATGA